MFEPPVCVLQERKKSWVTLEGDLSHDDKFTTRNQNLKYEEFEIGPDFIGN